MTTGSAPSSALARFEYEAGKTRDCTKVLMVEWEDVPGRAGEWTLTWEDRRTVLAARDTTQRGINRLYFLLSAKERVPGTVLVTLTSDGAPTIVLKAHPLPAIFPPELGASATEAGMKGVLHTIWAKRRLQVLATEVEDESRQNIEGVALTMAMQEKEWIHQNFGVYSKASALQPWPSATSPSSPRTPGGGRLMAKLKGLKPITTDEQHDLSDNLNPLSPVQSDVAIGSFGSFADVKGAPARPSEARIVQQRPPDAVLSQQRLAGSSSLDALASGAGQPASDYDDRDDDLFALPMSPRSPDMSKSPFSFAAVDTRY